jgi:hypothetical protein
VTGVLPDNLSGYQIRCLGAVEGSGATGYGGFFCNNGQWYIDNLIGLGSKGVIVGKQVAAGTLPFSSSDSYDISLAFGSGTGKLTITLAQGSASPFTQSFPAGQFTPATVGYGMQSVENYQTIGGPIGVTIGGFTYTAG